MSQEQRGLRFPINIAAGVMLGSAHESIPARVMELSLRGCFLEISAPLKEQQHLRLKIFRSGESFETSAEVLYVRATGAGVVFGDMAPESRDVLQAWVLAALDEQVRLEHS